jgi:hypothetical protein
VRVRPDLTIQAYDADPRAGTSYNLCCDVGADFREPAPSNSDQPDQAEQPAGPTAEQPDNSPLVPPIPPDSDEP